LIFRPILAALAALSLASCETSAAGPHANVPTRGEGAIHPRQGERVLDWPWQESDFRPDPDVRYGKLPNGMRYAIRANRTPTGTASARLRFDTGSLMEDEDQRGLAHLLEHMAFNGSRNVPEGEMVHMLQRHGLSFGAHTNAYTSFDETVYQLDAPNVRPETTNAVFMLMREVASNLTIAPDAVDRERGVVLSEERTSNTPDFRAQLAEWHALYPNARFASRVPIGLVEVVQHAPASRLRDYYETYYRPERAFFVISGDFDVDVMEAKIRQTFGDWHATRPDPGDPNLGAASGGAQTAFFYDPGLETSVELSVSHPALREANTSETVRQDILRTVANSILSRRLLRLARAPGAHFQTAQVGDQDAYDTLHVSSVSLTSRPEDWRAALDVGDQEIRRALRFGFTQGEIDEQVSRYRNGFQVAAQRGDTRTTPDLADEIVSQFGQWGVDTTPAFDLSLFERLAPSITPDAVALAFAAQWQGIQPQVFVSSGAQIENAPAQELAELATSEHIAVTPPTNSAALHFAYTDFGTPGTVAERHDIADLGVTSVRFANNVRLNLKHTEFAHDNVLVSVRFGGGILELPASEPGLGALLRSLPEGGLEAHSADDVQSILAGHTVRTAISADPDAFRFSGATNPQDLELQLQLMAAYLTHPGYRGEALNRFHQNIANQYPTLAATPGGVAQRDVGRLLRSGDARYGVPPLSDLTARSFDELRAALARASGHGAIEIGIVGDIDIERTIALVGSTFGALPERDAADPPFAEARRLAFPAGGHAAHVIHHQGQPNRAMALTYWPSTDDSNPRTQRTLELLRAVLSLKLIERVRESEGATYSPSAQAFFAHANPDYGYLGVSLDLVPENVNRFFGIVDQIAASLAAGDISADELERARRPILDDFHNDQEDNDYWMTLVATAQSDPLALQRHRSTAADYAAVTISDLRTAARRYLVADRACRIAILPGLAP
jgi:zinc protease